MYLELRGLVWAKSGRVEFPRVPGRVWTYDCIGSLWRVDQHIVVSRLHADTEHHISTHTHTHTHTHTLVEVSQCYVNKSSVYTTGSVHNMQRESFPVTCYIYVV